MRLGISGFGLVSTVFFNLLQFGAQKKKTCVYLSEKRMLFLRCLFGDNSLLNFFVKSTCLHTWKDMGF